MYIHDIKISGYRSLNPPGSAQLHKLGKVNLIVGPNNVGKSNLSNFLILLQRIMYDKRLVHSEFTNYAYSAVDVSHVDNLVEEVDYWLRKADLISFETTIDISQLLKLCYRS